MPRSQSRTPAVRTSAHGVTARKPRTAKQAKAEHRGGEWGRGVVARLRALKGTDGVNAFAERVHLAPSLVSSYLNGTRLPGAESLRTIAERTGVSLDWLLLGDRGEEPRFLGQSRTQAELAADVGAYVAHALRASDIPARVRAGGEIGEAVESFVGRVEVDGSGVLAAAVSDAQRDRDQLLERMYELGECALVLRPLILEYTSVFLRVGHWAAELAAVIPPGTAERMQQTGAITAEFAAGLCAWADRQPERTSPLQPVLGFVRDEYRRRAPRGGEWREGSVSLPKAPTSADESTASGMVAVAEGIRELSEVAAHITPMLALAAVPQMRELAAASVAEPRPVGAQ